MSSNQGTAGHEWGFVRGMTSQSRQSGPGDDTLNPATTASPAGYQQDNDQLTVFAIGDHYLFTGGFTDDEVLETLAPYYNRHQGRFEVGRGTFLEIERTLAQAGYDITIVTDPGEYAVVIDKTAPHPEQLVTESVFTVSIGDQNVFVLPSTAEVDRVVDEHVTPLVKTPVRLSLSAAAAVGPVTVRDVASQ